MNRKPIFDAIRDARGKGFTQDEVDRIDALLDTLDTAPALATGDELPEDYWPMLAKIESGNRPYVKASTSSASGLYQFIKSTWQGEGGTWGSDASKAFGGLFPSEQEQLRRAKTFTEKNAQYLRSKGIPINRASLYAAHFLGAGTAAEVIGADVKASAEALAGPAATKANPSILKGKTVGDFLTWLHAKTGAWAR
ncbi:transglycosylase family protein [Stakelama pacifica]|uniref:Transglycosylase-like protein with SLT domain n=1 Tax=Stakelama pacifica TaxID=517720 RepID=A0A4R6FLI9_9SPHN|nr:transglycosylase family protein [Stakelama pacifica]TDN81800.1 transglycosylase-like protein with SLT domain [Stakelama pacifica]GGO96606.1 hypothetical protein GCM10011329_23530 [Stakelama pacifica]